MDYPLDTSVGVAFVTCSNPCVILGYLNDFTMLSVVSMIRIGLVRNVNSYSVPRLNRFHFAST